MHTRHVQAPRSRGRGVPSEAAVVAPTAAAAPVTVTASELSAEHRAADKSQQSPGGPGSEHRRETPVMGDIGPRVFVRRLAARRLRDGGRWVRTGIEPEPGADSPRRLQSNWNGRGRPASGGEGTRTLDLRLAKPPLFQLSYTPKQERRASHATLDVWPWDWQL
jgi:hypothetical protein